MNNWVGDSAASASSLDPLFFNTMTGEIEAHRTSAI